MTPYLTMYAIVASILLLTSKVVKHQTGYLIFTVFAALFLFAGLRGVVGSDTGSYLMIYNELANKDGILFELSKTEPGFIALLSLHKAIFNSETLYIIMMSGFQVFLLRAVVKNSAKQHLFLLCYVFLFYLNFHFNITRSAIATMLFLYGICGKSVTNRRLALIFAPLFHVTILPFYLVLLRGTKWKHIVAVLGVAVLAIALNFEAAGLFAVKYLVYQNYGNLEKSGVSLYAVLLAVMALSSIFALKNSGYYFKWMAGALAVSYLVTNFYPVAFRLTIMASVFYYFFLIDELSQANKISLQLFFWIPVTLGFYFVVMGINNESEKLAVRINEGSVPVMALESTYIPYGFIWNDRRIKN